MSLLFLLCLCFFYCCKASSSCWMKECHKILKQKQLGFVVILSYEDDLK
jgi:hypothetical protein